MNYSNLKKEGTKIGETDLRDEGIYYGTVEYWALGTVIYTHIYRDNTLSYHGKEKETKMYGTVKSLIKELQKDVDHYNELNSFYREHLEADNDNNLAMLEKLKSINII